MRPTASQYAEALESLFREGIGAERLARNFFGLLKRRGELGQGNVVVRELAKKVAQQSKVLALTVVTARECEAETKALLMKKAEALFPGWLIEAHYEVDRGVVGGVCFRTAETLYDATVLAELNALKKVIHT